MSDIIVYKNCPVCSSTDIIEIFSVKDFTVSGAEFLIVECNTCTLRFTQNAPVESRISQYYKSESYISHSDTSKGLINKLYQKVRRRTMLKKRRMIEKLSRFKKGSLLDVGSGIGTFVSTMKEHGWDVTGIEPDPGARDKAKEIYNFELLEEKQLYTLSPHSFDAITLWHVLEHVYDLRKFIGQLKFLLKESGKIFIAVPNYTSTDAKIYKQFWAAYDVPRHLYHFSPDSMTILIESSGLKMLDYKPMWYDSFYISLLSSKYKHGKTKWVPALWNGFRSNLSALFDTEKCSSVIYVVGK